MLRVLLWPVLVVLLFGCAGSARRVAEGGFQKRKYRPGWHVDLGFGKNGSNRPMREPEPMAMLATRSSVPQTEPARSQLLQANTIPQLEEVRYERPRATMERYLIRSERTAFDTPSAAMEERTPAAWNIPSLIAIGIVVVALLSLIVQGGSSLFGYLLIAAFIAGLVGLLSAIARKERGKGFAIAAMAFSIAFVIMILTALSKLS